MVVSSVVVHRKAVSVRREEVSLLRVMPMVVVTLVAQTREGKLEVSLLPRCYAGIARGHTSYAIVLNSPLWYAGIARGHTSSVIAPNDGDNAFNK